MTLADFIFEHHRCAVNDVPTGELSYFLEGVSLGESVEPRYKTMMRTALPRVGVRFLNGQYISWKSTPYLKGEFGTTAVISFDQLLPNDEGCVAGLDDLI